MTFVDTNVFMYAVGRSHPLRDEVRAYFAETLASGEPLVTSVEVLQELLHAYLRVGRLRTLDSALALARALADVEEGVRTRDLLHLACTRRRNVRDIKTFDRALAAASARL